MKWRIVGVKVVGSYTLALTFKDGARRRVDLSAMLDGPVFEPLRDPAFFSQATLDRVAGTVTWPNGADIAPETLYELATQPTRRASRRSPNKARQRTVTRVARAGR